MPRRIRSPHSAPLFSIIIPTYNVENYIARCLESCINQTFSDIEILVVDDCGSDDSITIAQRYAKKDTRVRIIHNPQNLATFGARLAGIEAAAGQYLIFLDADDYFTLDTCEKIAAKLYKSAGSLSSNEQVPKSSSPKSAQNATPLENLPDIIHFRPIYQGAKSASKIANALHKLRYILPTQFHKKPLQSHQIAQNFFLKSSQFPKFTLWDKCYKTALIRQILPFMQPFIPLKLTMAEDMLKFFAISALAKSYVSLSERLYIYCLNHSSITQNPRAKDKKIADLLHIISALPSLAKELESRNPLMPQIAQRLCKNLAALIILESRFESSAQEVQASISHSLATLLESHAIHPPTIPRLFKPFSALMSLPYLRACMLSLSYWNRCLTYARIFAYLLSFGRVKL